ncbi:unnamed protein product [Fusarium langsethiae]|nr:unnamed protein product [Fusarium langsethiae]
MTAATVFDTILFRDTFGTEEIRDCFSERSYVSNLINAECALAQAEEDEGVIPVGTAKVIRELSDVSKIDWPLLAKRTEVVGYPILGLVEQIASWVPHQQAGYIHWGATTQDIMDLASWTWHHSYRSRMFGGAAGTLASLGDSDHGIRVRKRLAAILGLKDPVITWHVARDTIAEVVNFLALVGGSLGKIALDLIMMSSNELNEIAEPFVPHRGASSTMPQKRNPISSEIILAQSKILRAQAGLVLDGMVSDFERASGPWHLEWASLPVAFISVVGSLHQANFALSGLQVNSNAMKANLESTRGLIVAEAVMMKLAEFVGRQEAHEIVYGACAAAVEENLSLIESLQKIDEVTRHLTEEQVLLLVDPTNYLGCCRLMVDELLGSTGASLKRKANTNGMNGTNAATKHGVSNMKNGYQ